jgi:hypothetical protein
MVKECVERYRKEYCESKGMSDKALEGALARIERRFGDRLLTDLERSAPIHGWMLDMEAEGRPASITGASVSRRTGSGAEYCGRARKPRCSAGVPAWTRPNTRAWGP